jgi:threonine aldolase
LDGARLGYGLMSKDTDVTLEDVAALCDVFYIGGTKVGPLCGEAVLFTKNNAPKHFMTTVKQRGALLAKGRLLGVQFDALFTDSLYFEISKHAINMADILKQGLMEKGYQFFIDSPTNQQFIILENAKMEELKDKVAFSFWEKYDENHTVVRFATSWATKEEDIKALLDLL